MSEHATATAKREILVGTHVSAETHDRLRALAVREDRSAAAILRRALNRELAANEETKP